MTRKLIGMVLAACITSPALIACEKEGPAQQVGRQVDEAGDKADGALENLGRQIGEAADESKEAADAIKESVD
jgi:hypothetical protein